MHSSHRSELGLQLRLSITTRGYCLHSLLQCHLSGAGPLTYSSITNPAGNTIGASIISNLPCRNLFPLLSACFPRACVTAILAFCVKGSVDTFTHWAFLIQIQPSLSIQSRFELKSFLQKQHNFFCSDFVATCEKYLFEQGLALFCLEIVLKLFLCMYLRSLYAD
jgi:hypothetical protein